jgi:peptide deformylase
MPARRIRQLGDPLLREISAPVTRPEDARLIVRDLRATLRKFRLNHGFGRGISAVQIGEPSRIIYLEVDGVPYTLINPHFEWQSDERFRLWDDCFSFPGLLVYVERSVSVQVRYQDMSGESNVLEGTGPLSELLQHEMDHLDGILAVDRAIDRTSFCTRDEYERRYRPDGRQQEGKGKEKTQ